MVLIISEHLKTQINQAAAMAYPLECCGLMLGRILSTGLKDHLDEDEREVIDLVPTDNRWGAAVQEVTDPQAALADGRNKGLSQHRRYWIDPTMMLKVQQEARDRNLDIIGVYHSHPDHPAIPSECDRRLAWPVYSYVIVSVKAGQVENFLSWRLNNEHQFRSEPVEIFNKI